MDKLGGEDSRSALEDFGRFIYRFLGHVFSLFYFLLSSYICYYLAFYFICRRRNGGVTYHGRDLKTEYVTWCISCDYFVVYNPFSCT